MFINRDRLTATRYSLAEHGKDYRLSPHFVLGEFASGDGSDVVYVDRRLIEGLEQIRSHFGNRPVRINSGYRSEEWNETIGGAKHSKHKEGTAADIVIEGVRPDEVANYAIARGFGGVGRYDTFTHVDVSGVNRRWDNRKEKVPAIA